MRWFFLAFISLLGILGFGAIFSSNINTFSKVFGIISYILFIGSLVLIWSGAYYAKAKTREVGVFGHAGLMLAAGTGFIGIGIHGFSFSTCSHIFRSDSYGFFGNFSQFLLNYLGCNTLLVLVIGFGVLIMWPSIKFVIGLTSRSS